MIKLISKFYNRLTLKVIIIIIIIIPISLSLKFKVKVFLFLKQKLKMKYYHLKGVKKKNPIEYKKKKFH